MGTRPWPWGRGCRPAGNWPVVKNGSVNFLRVTRGATLILSPYQTMSIFAPPGVATLLWVTLYPCAHVYAWTAQRLLGQNYENFNNVI